MKPAVASATKRAPRETFDEWPKRRAADQAFYIRLGLDPSPLEAMTLMTTVADLQAPLF